MTTTSQHDIRCSIAAFSYMVDRHLLERGGVNEAQTAETAGRLG